MSGAAINTTATSITDTAIGPGAENTDMTNAGLSAKKVLLQTVHLTAQPIAETAFEAAIDAVTHKNDDAVDESAPPLPPR